MRQKVTFIKALLLIFLFIFAQSLFGRWMIWSRVMPEWDFASLVLFSLSIGRVRGTLLGSFVGVLRDAFSHHPFGLGVFVLAGIGFVSGSLGEHRRMRRPWQKFLFIFSTFFIADSLLLLLGGAGGSVSPLGVSAYYLESVLPSALSCALMGLFIGRLL